MNIRDAAIRAVRTFVQAAIGTVLASGVVSGIVDSSTVDVSALQRVGVAAVAAGVIAVLSFIQNVIEDNTSVPSVK